MSEPDAIELHGRTWVRSELGGYQHGPFRVWPDDDDGAKGWACTVTLEPSVPPVAGGYPRLGRFELYYGRDAAAAAVAALCSIHRVAFAMGMRYPEPPDRTEEREYQEQLASVGG